MSAAAPRLRMRGICRRFGPTVALDGVDIDVAPGQVHALIGENGAGKSTLMKVLSGALRPDAGAMALDGVPYKPAHPLAARAAGVAMVYQELSLAPQLSVGDNVLLGIEPVRRGGLLRRAAGRSRVEAALARLEHPEITPEVRVADLPPSARQLVEIARALVVEARVLVLDEPTSSLAAADVERLFGLIRRLRDDGLSVVYISHFLEEVRRVADRFTVLRDGRVAGTGDVDDTTADDMVRLMVGRGLDELYPRSSRAPGEVVLSVSGLANPPRLLEAGFELRRGEVLGIAGLLGAGRTELLRSLFGLDPVAGGQVRVGTVGGTATVGGASPRQRLAQGVGLLSEDRAGEGLATDLSLTDNLTLPNPGGRWGIVTPTRLRATARTWIERLAIRTEGPDQPVRDLSGGNQQKVALARLLHADVDVLLLDEPTRGVDVASKAQIYSLVDELATAGKAILWVSSYLPELLGVADRIAVMARGRLAAARPVGDWNEHELLLAATDAGDTGEKPRDGVEGNRP